MCNLREIKEKAKGMKEEDFLLFCFLSIFTMERDRQRENEREKKKAFVSSLLISYCFVAFCSSFLFLKLKISKKLKATKQIYSHFHLYNSRVKCCKSQYLIYACVQLHVFAEYYACISLHYVCVLL